MLPIVTHIFLVTPTYFKLCKYALVYPVPKTILSIKNNDFRAIIITLTLSKIL